VRTREVRVMMVITKEVGLREVRTKVGTKEGRGVLFTMMKVRTREVRSEGCESDDGYYEGDEDEGGERVSGYYEGGGDEGGERGSGYYEEGDGGHHSNPVFGIAYQSARTW